MNQPSSHPGNIQGSHPSKGVLYTLLGASSLTVLAAAIIAPSLQAMKEQFIDTPHVEFLVQLILTTPALFIVFGSPIAGWFSDRAGRRPVLLVGLVGYAFAGSTGLYLDSLAAILVGRALLGLSVAAVMTGATTLLSDLYEGEERQRVLGIQAAFMGLGGVVFLLLGGFLAELDWRYPYGTYLLSLLLVLPAWTWITEPQTEESPSKGMVEQGYGMPWRVVLPAAFFVFIIEVCFYLIPVQIPFRFANLGYTEPWRVSVAISCVSGVFALTASQASRLRGLIGLNLSFAIGFSISGMALYLIGAIDSFAGLIVPFMVMGAGFGLIIPNLTAWIASETLLKVRGRAMGLYSAALFFGQFMAPVVSQPVVNASSVSFMYAGAAACCLVVAVIAWHIAPKYPVQAEIGA